MICRVRPGLAGWFSPISLWPGPCCYRRMTFAIPSDSPTTTGRATPTAAGQPNRPAKAGHDFARLITDQRQAGTTLASDSASPIPAPASDLPAPTGRAHAAASPAGTRQASPPAGPAEPLALVHSEPIVGASPTQAARLVRTTTASPTAVEAPEPPDLSAAAPVTNAGLLVLTPQNSPVAMIGSDAKSALAPPAAAGGIEPAGASNGEATGPTPQAILQAEPSPTAGFSSGLGQAALATRQAPAGAAQLGPVPVDTPHSAPASANAGAAPRAGRASPPARVAVDRSTPDRAGLAYPITDPDNPSTVTRVRAVVDGATRSHPAGPAAALQQPVPGAQPAATGPVPGPETLPTGALAVPGALVSGEQPAQALAAAESLKLLNESAVDTPAVPSSAALAGPLLAGPLLTGPDGPRTTLAPSPTLPAAQVAAALAALPAPMPTNGAGPLTPPRVLSVQLDPEELGRVRIRIDQGGDGPARVDLTAERPETLQLLLRDQTALHHALDQAGVTPDARVIRFHLADLEAIAPTPTAPPAPLPQPQPAASFGGGFGPGGQASGQADSQHRGQAAPQATTDSGFGPGWTPPNPIPTRRAGNRARVDITA